MLDMPNISITGLTGMSGAGKSTAAKIFSERGFNVLDCDLLARNTTQDPRFLNELCLSFGEKLLNADGTLDRKKTAEVVFSDKEKNARYQSLIFPYITYKIMKAVRCYEGEGGILLDAPTLFEAKLDMFCDNIVSVIASEEICVRRISNRDRITEDQARARLWAQHSAEFFKRSSDYVIENNSDSDTDFLSSEIDRIIKALRNG